MVAAAMAAAAREGVGAEPAQAHVAAAVATATEERPEVHAVAVEGVAKAVVGKEATMAERVAGEVAVPTGGSDGEGGCGGGGIVGGLDGGGGATEQVTRTLPPPGLVRLHSPEIPPMHASDAHASVLSPTLYTSPFGQVHCPPQVPTPTTPYSTLFTTPGGYCGGGAGDGEIGGGVGGGALGGGGSGANPGGCGGGEGGGGLGGG
eukprot:scaffold298082_cov30-Tisochrysis_lutea.AAC.2